MKISLKPRKKGLLLKSCSRKSEMLKILRHKNLLNLLSKKSRVLLQFPQIFLRPNHSLEDVSNQRKW